MTGPLHGARVLVTGLTGFKGTWLGWWLVRLGADVLGLALPPEPGPSLFLQSALGARVPWIAGDVRQPGVLADAVARHRPALVIHLAAQALVGRAHRDPIGTLETNILGTARLLEAIRAAERPCGVLVVTSDKCYQPGRAAMDEDAPLGAGEPYSASKAGQELVCQAWRRSYFPRGDTARHGVVLATARAGNAIGPGDHAPDRLVPDCLRALDEGRPIPLRRPEAVRPWQHVLEPLAGYLWLACLLHPARTAVERSAVGRAWNLGPIAAHTVRAVVEAVLEAAGEGRWVLDGPGDAAEVPYLSLDTRAARTLLGLSDVYTLAEATARTVAAHRALAAVSGPEATCAVIHQEITALCRAAVGQPWAAALSGVTA